MFFRLADIPAGYYIASLTILLCSQLSRKRWTVSLLVSYTFLVIALTILIRETGAAFRFELVPFWSYRDYLNGTDKTLLSEIIANIVMFIPIGILTGSIWGQKSAWLAMGFSTIIELLQLITKRGLFEFDDIIHNTLGALIGIALLMAGKKVIGFFESRLEKK